MREPPRIVDSPIARLLELLVCPVCHRELQKSDGWMRCEACLRDYPLLDTTAVMNEPPGDLNAGTESREEAILEKQLHRDREFLESGRRIRRQRRELHIVTEFLSELPASEALLDLGCRGGRYSGPMQSATRLLIEADRHLPIVRHAIGKAMNPAKVAGLVCTPDQLPFADLGIDGTVCVRLSHRIDGATGRERLLHESLRVSSRFVVFSFNDAASLPNLSRRLRAKPINGGTMSLETVARIGELHGATIRQTATVSPFGSRHRFVSLVKPS